MENMKKNKEYEYLISKGHHLVKIDDKVLVIDTGSPLSFSIAGDFNSIEINESVYEMKKNIAQIGGNALN